MRRGPVRALRREPLLNYSEIYARGGIRELTPSHLFPNWTCRPVQALLSAETSIPSQLRIQVPSAGCARNMYLYAFGYVI